MFTVLVRAGSVSTHPAYVLRLCQGWQYIYPSCLCSPSLSGLAVYLPVLSMFSILVSAGSVSIRPAYVLRPFKGWQCIYPSCLCSPSLSGLAVYLPVSINGAFYISRKGTILSKITHLSIDTD